MDGVDPRPEPAAIGVDRARELAPGHRSAALAYEPPRLIALGTLAELTAGVNPTTSDGLGPGSIL